ncbi:MAG: hypothetical protein HYV18_07555 [Gammaproteobacteria bacterium]|nr:hypothetical protein [Gammaproteobacteria bacterium]
MIIPRYRITDSLIPGAGKGLILDEPVPHGRVVVVPDRIDRLIPHSAWAKLPRDSIEARSSARWFEDWFSLTPEWTDECYINHASDPTGMWHLGFVFAARDLAPGTELTMDYRYVIGTGEVADFTCSKTGEQIVGLPWRENLVHSAQSLLALLGETPALAVTPRATGTDSA